jgi:short-subunit dehydrogenase
MNKPVALVTGASSGIGSATAAALARRGYRVVVHGRDEDALAKVARRVDGVAVAVDLARPDGAELLAARALDCAGGRVDVLVNNAGIGWAGSFADMPADRIQALMAVNVAAPVALTRLLLPGMLERGHGRLVFVTSIAGRLGVAGEAVYAATKAGIDCFAESLRAETRGSGVAVCVVVPGVVDTPFFERRGASYTRSRPRPIPATAVADAVARCVETGAAEAYAPRWLRLPVAVRGVLPGAYRRLDARFGGGSTQPDAQPEAQPEARARRD